MALTTLGQRLYDFPPAVRFANFRYFLADTNEDCDITIVPEYSDKGIDQRCRDSICRIARSRDQRRCNQFAVVGDLDLKRNLPLVERRTIRSRITSSIFVIPPIITCVGFRSQ